jgi:hypothetical protein
MDKNGETRLSVIKIFIGIFIKPAKTWKLISDKNQYKYMWLFFWVILEISVIPYALLNQLDLVFAFLLINSLIWVILLIQWGFIYAGFAAIGIKTKFTFINNIRLYSYNSVISLVFLPFTIAQAIIAPKTLSMVEKFPHYAKKPDIVLINNIASLIFSLWFLVLLIIAVKNVFNINYRKAGFAVLFIPGIIGFAICSIILLIVIFR